MDFVDQDAIFNVQHRICTLDDFITYAAYKFLYNMLYDDIKFFIPDMYHCIDMKFKTTQIYTNYNLHLEFNTSSKVINIRKFDDPDYVIQLCYVNDYIKYFKKKNKFYECISFEVRLNPNTVQLRTIIEIRETNKILLGESTYNYDTVEDYNKKCLEHMQGIAFQKRIHPYVHSVWLTQQPYEVTKMFYDNIEKTNMEATETMLKLDKKIHDLRQTVNQYKEQIEQIEEEQKKQKADEATNKN